MDIDDEFVFGVAGTAVIGIFVAVRNNCIIHEDASAADDDDNHIISLILSRLIRNDAIRIKFYVEQVIWTCPDAEFQSHFRLTRESFNLLLQRVSPLLDSPHPVGRQADQKLKKLLSVIWLLATSESYRSVAERFDMSKSELFYSFIKVIGALNIIAPDVIVWPDQAKRHEISRGFEAQTEFPGIVGAIDSTYVPIRAPTVSPRSYYCRKMFHAINLQGVCDHNLLFLDCFAGYPGAVADVRVFRNSDIYDNLRHRRNLYLDNNQFIIGDKAYPLENWCIIPFVANHVLTARERNFNLIHARARTVIERTWALLFGRFRRLQDLDMRRIDLIPSTIISCCVLHNICCMAGEDHEAGRYQAEGDNFLQLLNNNNNNNNNNGGDNVNGDGEARRNHLTDLLY